MRTPVVSLSYTRRGDNQPNKDLPALIPWMTHVLSARMWNKRPGFNSQWSQNIFRKKIFRSISVASYNWTPIFVVLIIQKYWKFNHKKPGYGTGYGIGYGKAHFPGYGKKKLGYGSCHTLEPEMTPLLRTATACGCDKRVSSCEVPYIQQKGA